MQRQVRQQVLESHDAVLVSRRIRVTDVVEHDRFSVHDVPQLDGDATGACGGSVRVVVVTAPDLQECDACHEGHN
jgi:hypothetical protein